MALTRTPPVLRRRAPTTTLLRQQRRHASPFFALSKLSNSRETQHLNRITKLPRPEHSPSLKLIQTSEVEPFSSSASAGEDDVRTAVRHEKTPDEQTEAWTSLPDEARRDIWAQWVEGGRARSLVELAGEWRVRQTVASASSSSAASSGDNEGGDGKKQPEGVEPAPKDEFEIDDDKALKMGRKFYTERAQEKYKLEQELEEKRRRAEEATGAAEKLEYRIVEKEQQLETLEWKTSLRRTPPTESPSELALFWSFFKTVALIGLGVWIGSVAEKEGQKSKKGVEVQENVRIGFLTKRVASLEADAAKAAEKQKVSTNEATQKIANLKAEMQDAAAKARAREDAQQAMVAAEGKAVAAKVAEVKALEAKMADWTTKAEQLKRAVESKDVGKLSKAERDAYLEALVFLRVKEKKGQSWLGGLFWREE